MNRREFGRLLVAVGVASSLPEVALPKPAIDHSRFGQHLAEFDNNDAIISTAQRAIGTLWYGNIKPEIILSPPRVAGRMWCAIMPSQRVKAENSHRRLYPGLGKEGFRFCGAVWMATESLTDEIVLINTHYPRETGNAWFKHNGWYRASKLILADSRNDRYYTMIEDMVHPW